jgi:hypothetical protein
MIEHDANLIINSVDEEDKDSSELHTVFFCNGERVSTEEFARPCLLMLIDNHLYGVWF